jgi:hypothetical protein
VVGVKMIFVKLSVYFSMIGPASPPHGRRVLGSCDDPHKLDLHQGSVAGTVGVDEVDGDLLAPCVRHALLQQLAGGVVLLFGDGDVVEVGLARLSLARGADSGPHVAAEASRARLQLDPFIVAH